MNNIYTDLELCCAMVNDIVEQMDFKINIDDNMFSLIDLQGAYWGDIDKDRFENLESLLDRLDIYINDYYLEDMDELLESKSIWELDKWDYTKMSIAFIYSNKCGNLRSQITPEIYESIEKKFAAVGKPTLKDIRTIIPLGMIFQEDVLTGQKANEFYSSSEYSKKLTEAFKSEKIPKMVFDFSDQDLFFKAYSQSELEWEGEKDAVY